MCINNCGKFEWIPKITECPADKEWRSNHKYHELLSLYFVSLPSFETCPPSSTAPSLHISSLPRTFLSFSPISQLSSRFIFLFSTSRSHLCACGFACWCCWSGVCGCWLRFAASQSAVAFVIKRLGRWSQMHSDEPLSDTLRQKEKYSLAAVSWRERNVVLTFHSCEEKWATAEQDAEEQQRMLGVDVSWQCAATISTHTDTSKLEVDKVFECDNCRYVREDQTEATPFRKSIQDLLGARQQYK